MEDVEAAVEATRRLRGGLVWANTTLDAAPQLSFGGTKSSGCGRETGAEELAAFTVLRTLVINSGKPANIDAV